MKVTSYLSLILMMFFSLNASAKLNELKKKKVRNTDEMYSFEGTDVSSEFVTNTGKLTFSKRHFKEGKQSLLWAYDAGAVLTVNSPYLETAAKSKQGGVLVWIYREEASNGMMVCNFGARDELVKGQVAYQFEMKMNFVGWRGFWVHFREDALVRGAKKQVVNQMQLIAPDTKGQICIDNLAFDTKISSKRSDDNFKVINNEIDHFGVSHPWEYTNFWSKQEVLSADAYEWTDDMSKAFEKIEAKYDYWTLGDDSKEKSEAYLIREKSLNKFIENGVELFADFNVVRHADGHITGKPLYTMKTDLYPWFCYLSMDVALPLAYDYKLNGNKESLDNYLLMIDYMHDQGWADGSANATLDHEMLRHAGYFHSLYIMRDELREAGVLQREIATAKWYLNWGEFYNMPDYTGCTADFMRTYFMYRLLVVLAMDDGPEKVRDMHLYHKWINLSMKVSPGFADTFKPDFTGYHHRGLYTNAYSPNAFHLASVICYILDDTPFEASHEAISNLKKSLLTARLMLAGYNLPYTITARFPEKDTNFPDIVPGLAYMSLVDSDDEITAAFKRLWQPELPLFKDELFPQAKSSLEYFHTLGAIQIMEEANALTVAKEVAPEGNWYKPYAGMTMHRRGEWLVGTKGWSSYIWDFESGGSENVFGRYLSNGSMIILSAGEPVNSLSSGYNPGHGYDWSRIPGATALHLPLREMEHNGNGKTLIADKSTHRNFTDQTFLGGVSDKAGNGIFANKLHDTAYDPSFWARKSVFFFDNMIVCLASGIQSADEDYDVETTLFQIYDNDEKAVVNGKELGDAYKTITEDKSTTWISSPIGNTYYIPAGQDVNVHYQQQNSIDESGKIDTEGDYFTAWINHGKAPVSGDYEYAIFIKPEAKQIESAKQATPYQVLQKDNAMHIVKLNTSYNYVVWDEEAAINHGKLKSVSTPSMTILTEEDDKLDLSFSDPDLRRPKLFNISGLSHDEVVAGAYPQLVRIEIAGDWNVPQGSPFTKLGVLRGNTLLQVKAINGETYQVSLYK